MDQYRRGQYRNLGRVFDPYLDEEAYGDRRIGDFHSNPFPAHQRLSFNKNDSERRRAYYKTNKLELNVYQDEMNFPDDISNINSENEEKITE